MCLSGSWKAVKWANERLEGVGLEPRLTLFVIYTTSSALDNH